MKNLVRLLSLPVVLAMTFSCGETDEELLYDLDNDGKADFGYATDPDFDYEQCPGGAPHLVERSDGTTGPAAWTVMHFAAGDNNLEDVLLQDIHEMERGHSGTDNVNIVVQLDMESEDGMWRYEVAPASPEDRVDSPTREDLVSIEVAHDEAEPESADEQTLIEFGRWAINCYPAERYGVIIGGHGGGWSSTLTNRSSHRSSLSLRAREARRTYRELDSPAARLIAPDDTNGTEMYVDELALALTEIRNMTVRCGETSNGWECENAELINRLALYGSDACLMGDMGVVFDLRNTAMLVIGSEETEPAMGWPYNTAMRTLTERPYYYAQRPYRLAEDIVEAYGRSFSPGGSADEDTSITLAAVDTAAVWRMANALETMATMMTGLLEEGILDPHYIITARENAFSFGDGYTDLGLFTVLLRDALIEAQVIPAPGEHLGERDERLRTLRDAMDTLLDDLWVEFIIASVAGSSFVRDGREVMGVSVFLPTDDCYYGMSLEDFATSAFSQVTKWDRFLQALSNAESSLEFQEAKGFGYMDPASFTVGGQTHAFTHAIECEFSPSNTMLSVYIEEYGECITVEGSDGETRCIRPPSISFDLDEQDLVLDGISVYSWSSDFDIDWQVYDSSDIQVALEQHESGQYYRGAFDVTFPRNQDNEEEVALHIEFECDEFEVVEANCYDDDWWW